MKANCLLLLLATNGALLAQVPTNGLAANNPVSGNVENAVLTGTLAITLSDAENWGKPGVNAGAALYNSGDSLIAQASANVSSVVTFSGIPAGTGYYYRVFSHKPTAWGEQFWGEKTGITVDANLTTLDAFTHNTPYMPNVSVYLNNTNELLPDSGLRIVQPGTPLRIELQIKNPAYDGARTVLAYGGVYLDRDKNAPYDVSVFSSEQSYPIGTSRTVVFYCDAPSGEGDYYLSVGTFASSTRYPTALTDASGWHDPAFRVAQGGVSNYWVSTNGPGLGNDVRSLAVDSKGRVLAGTWSSGGTVWRSSDNGLSWAQLGTIPISDPVMGISVNAQDHIFLSVITKGFYRSTDEGASWQLKNNGLTNLMIRGNLVDKNGYVWVASEGGLFRSKDNADTWVLVKDVNFAAVFLDSTGAIVTRDANSIYRSTNSGDSWSTIPSPGSSLGGIHPDGSYFYWSLSSALYRSTNFGVSWTNLNNPFAFTCYTAAMAFNARGDIFFAQNGDAAGVIMSTDMGASWTLVNSGLPTKRVIPLLYHPNGYVYVGTGGYGVFRTRVQTQPGVGPTSGLIAYYPFNGNAVDASGNHHDGVVYGATPTADRFGVPNAAYAFNGLSNYIEVGSDAALNPTSEISYAGWFQVGSTTQFGNIFSKGNDHSVGYYVARVHPAPINLGLAIMFTQDQPANGPTSVNASNVSLSVGRWYFFVVTFNGQTLSSYVDGVLANTLPVYKTLGSNQGPLSIGKHPLAGYEYWFKGTIDDVRLYNRALSLDDITALYHEGGYPVVSLPPWKYVNTGTSHTIIIPIGANPNIGGTPLSSGDYVGVFYDSSGTLACAGYDKWTGTTNIAVSAFGDDPTSGAKDGFATGEAFRWKIFRTSERRAYDAEATYTAIGGVVTHTNAYATNGISQLASLIGALSTHNVGLRSGWGLISSYVVPQSTVLDNIFAPVLSDLILLKNGAQKTYIPSVPVNTIGSWMRTEGYQIKMANPRTVGFSGQKIMPGALTIPLPLGWSIMPYVRDSEMPVATALSGVVGDVVIVKDQDGKTYIPSVGVNLIGSLKVGQGYQIKMGKAHTFEYPAQSISANSAELGNSTNSRNATNGAPPWFYANTGVSQTIIIPAVVHPTIDGSALSAGDYVGVFYDSSGTPACAGFEMWAGTNALAVSAFGDDPTTSAKDGLAEGELLRWRIWRQSDGHTFVAMATYLSPGGLGGIVTDTNKYATNAISAISALAGSVTGVTSKNIPTQFTLMQNFPNPFNPSTTITFGLPERSRVRLIVYNTLGEQVAELSNGEMEAGYYTVRFEASMLSSGVYFYRMEAGTFRETRKILLLR